jgi:hypothetical protein
MLERRHMLAGLAALGSLYGNAAGWTPALAQPATPRLVLGGYDCVAYFTVGKPTRGSPQFTHDWDAGRYHFASAANRSLFAADPDRYAPQYSGNCAGNMAAGRVVAPNPENWVISNGRLYVFASAEGPARFGGPDGPNLIRRADANWRTIKR